MVNIDRTIDTIKKCIDEVVEINASDILLTDRQKTLLEESTSALMHLGYSVYIDDLLDGLLDDFE